MGGGCLSCFFKYISVLFLGFCLHDVEAHSCQHVIHKKVGDTVEFSSCLPTEGVTVATWQYGGDMIADKDILVSGSDHFKGRLDLNPTNFSLTIRRLTLKDSGEFKFLSEVNNKQRKTVTVTLQVHEPITKQPVIIPNTTWHTLNESCTVLLECSSTTDHKVVYKWTVNNQTTSGSRLQFIMEPQDGDTRFTCTVSNHVSEMSASRTVQCSNTTSVAPPGRNFIILLSAVGGVCLVIVVIVGVAVCVFHCKQRQAVADSNELTVYADISEVAAVDGTSPPMKSCRLYETVEKSADTVPPTPQTVYDKIQFSRMRKASVSPYQEIS